MNRDAADETDGEVSGDFARNLEGQSIGPYRVLRRAGSGGMGEVFAAWDARLGRTVALKRVRMGGAGAALAARERFRREARAAAGLSHPGVVQVFDLLEAEGEDWIVMEYVEGSPLSALLKDGPLARARFSTRVRRSPCSASASTGSQRRGSAIRRFPRRSCSRPLPPGSPGGPCRPLRPCTWPALVNAERAVRGGISPRWLRLPWFDVLHREAAFRKLLTPEASPPSMALAAG